MSTDLKVEPYCKHFVIKQSKDSNRLHHLSHWLLDKIRNGNDNIMVFVKHSQKPEIEKYFNELNMFTFAIVETTGERRRTKADLKKLGEYFTMGEVKVIFMSCTQKVDAYDAIPKVAVFFEIPSELVDMMSRVSQIQQFASRSKFHVEFHYYIGRYMKKVQAENVFKIFYCYDDKGVPRTVSDLKNTLTTEPNSAVEEKPALRRIESTTETSQMSFLKSSQAISREEILNLRPKPNPTLFTLGDSPIKTKEEMSNSEEPVVDEKYENSDEILAMCEAAGISDSDFEEELTIEEKSVEQVQEENQLEQIQDENQLEQEFEQVDQEQCPEKDSTASGEDKKNGKFEESSSSSEMDEFEMQRQEVLMLSKQLELLKLKKKLEKTKMKKRREMAVPSSSEDEEENERLPRPSSRSHNRKSTVENNLMRTGFFGTNSDLSDFDNFEENKGYDSEDMAHQDYGWDA